MFGEFKFDLSGTNAILLLVIVGATLVLFYMEIRKLKVQIQGILKRIEIISGEQKEPNLDMKQIPEKLTMDEISGSFIPMNEELNNYPIRNDRVNIPQENIPQEDIPQENIPQENIPQEDIPQENIPQENIPQEKSKNISDYPIDNIKDLMLSSSDEEFDHISEQHDGAESGIESGIESDIESEIESEIGSNVEEETESYDNCTVNELKSILTELNLPLSGNKKKLIQRIKDNK
jgi:hypothetical protein